MAFDARPTCGLDKVGVAALIAYVGAINVLSNKHHIQDLDEDELRIAVHGLERTSVRISKIIAVTVLVPVAIAFVIFRIALLYGVPEPGLVDVVSAGFVGLLCAWPFWFGFGTIRHRWTAMQRNAEQRWAEIQVELAFRAEVAKEQAGRARVGDDTQST